MDKRDKVAELYHEQWSGWMKYLFQKCANNPDGSCTIPPELVERWTRQIETDFDLLSENEKNSDRKEADKFLGLFSILSKEEHARLLAHSIAEMLRQEYKMHEGHWYLFSLGKPQRPLTDEEIKDAQSRGAIPT